MVRATALVVILAFSTTGPAAAAGLDVRAWLARSGTRLVAVEFYATWCKPCMDSVPRWKALHQKYRNEGLRLVVVSTLDPDGACVNPGWNPDEMVCDTEGVLAKSMGVGGKLPSAFLWSWQGELLVRGGHIREVEQAVDKYMASSPRVLVEATDVLGRPSPSLRDQVRERLLTSGKLPVVASDAERAVLRRIQATSLGSNFDDARTCAIGKEVPANALVRATLRSDQGVSRLFVHLVSAESGCLVAAGSAPWRNDRSTVSVAEAIDKLLSQMQAPSDATSSLASETQTEVDGGGDRSGAARPLPEAIAPREDAVEAYFRSALSLEKLGRWADVTVTLDDFIRKFGRDEQLKRRVVEAHKRMGDAYEKLGSTAKAKVQYAACIDRFRRGRFSNTDEASSHAAQCAFELAESAFRDLDAIRIEGSGRKQAASLTKKAGQQRLVEQMYADVCQYNRADVTFSAMYRIGDTYDRFAEAMYAAEIPPEFARDEELAMEYRIQLEDKAGVLKRKAAAAYRRANDEAMKSGLANEWTQRIVEGLEKRQRH